MREKLFSCLLLISLQGGTEDRLKVGGGRGGSVGVSLGHGSCCEGEKRLVDGRRSTIPIPISDGHEIVTRH